MSTPLIGDYSEYGIENEYQRIPDIPVQLKFKDKFGHIQLSAILRVMNYYSINNIYPAMRTELDGNIFGGIGYMAVEVTFIVS